MLRGSLPDVRGRDEYDAKIEVMIDANGYPVMNTLRITGQVGGSARFAIESWIREAAFIPGKRDGTPVAMLFVTGIRRTVR